MDVWIVAAAAGAGYVAQRLKNLTMRRHDASDLSSENFDFVRPEPPQTPQKVHFEEEICRQRGHDCHDACVAAMTSTSGFESANLVQLDHFAGWGMASDLNSLAGLFNKEDIQGDWESRVSSDTDEVITGDSVPPPSLREIGFTYGFRQNRSRLRSRKIDSNFIKPRTSLESCLMAQLFKEHAEVDEYTYSVHSPKKPTMRPFLVTDGSRIISSASHHSYSKPTGTGKYKQSKDTHLQENKTVLCVPRLSNVASMELRTEAKAKTGKEQAFVRNNTSEVVNRNQSNAQGSLDGTLLFFLGLTMGMSYSLLDHKRETEKLRTLLKQTENLVQDLQEDLEMKDVLAVKELAVECYESLNVLNDSYFGDAMQSLSLDPKLDNSSRYCNGENSDQKTEEESFRKIEAELEAELDRLESNMNSSKLEGKLSNVAELDQDSVSFAIKGELRTDLFGAKTGMQSSAETNKSSSSSTPRSVHYPVSPRELSLRLHEVIQSRLEERVKELETALEYSQRKINCMESKHAHSRSEFPNHRTGSLSNNESPVAIDGLQSVDQLVVINLSGEALSAYNEFTKLSESDKEESNHQEILRPHRQDVENGCLNRHMKQQHSASLNCQQEDADNTASNGVICSSRDESEDESERLLIRQIVEKARQGSPAILKAQRALLSTHEYKN